MTRRLKFDSLNTLKLRQEFIHFDPSKGLRFGEYICNTYLEKGETDSEIFNEPSNETAFTLLLGILRS